MGKKKSGPSKPRATRKAKLRLVDSSPIGLTDAQQKELGELYRPLGREFGSFSDPKEVHRRIGLGRLLYLYIEALCHDARVENANLRTRRITALRRRIVADINKLCGREFSPDDIIKELAKHAPVPKYAASAIRRDYLRISV
jgi:hypothetical protein